MSSSAERQRDVHKNHGKRKRTSNFCSTPIVENARRLSSISISAIDTNSSSSTRRRTPEVDVGTKGVKKKRLKKRHLERRKGKRVRKTSRNEDEEDKRKKNKSLERRIFDDDWETCDDESFRQTTEFDTDVLFKDIRSPEHIRDAPSFVPDYSNSPLLRARRLEVDDPRISLEQDANKLLVNDLPSARVQFDDTDDEGDVFPLLKENAAKCYPGVSKRQKIDAGVQKCKAWLVDVSIPTTSSDGLWENFIANNCDRIGKYLAPPRKDGPTMKNTEIDTDKSSEEEGNHNGKQSLKWKDKIPFIDNAEIWRGHWDKSLHKWIRNKDVYNFQENANEKFPQMGTCTKHVTLKQFRRKMKAKRRNNSTQSGSSSSSVLYSSNISENLVEEKACKRNMLPKNSDRNSIRTRHYHKTGN